MAPAVTTEFSFCYRQLDAVFDEARMNGAMHAIDLTSGRELCYDHDRLVQPASVAKLCVLVAIMQACDAGSVALTSVVDIPAGPRTPGSTGLSVMTDAARLTVRDLALLMMSISDNDATDRLFRLVAPAEVTRAMRGLGLTRTAVECTIAESVERQASFEPDRSPWRTTPEDMTRLLHLIWADEAASPALCEQMRVILAAQAFPRLSSGFPDEVHVASKTGTVPGVRNAVGVVEFPDGQTIAIGIFGMSERTDERDLAGELAIGRAAAVAAHALRTVQSERS